MNRAVVGVALLAAVILAPASVSAQDRIKAGTLDCDISGGIGFIIGSKKAVDCNFVPAAPGWPQEVYVGNISKFGLDIGATSGGRMIWTVFAAASPAPHALAGEYVGASAEATVAAGLGANALVGGSNRSIALQPLSLQGQTGFNVAVGVSSLTLRAAR
jgi:Protein of unknown function (DUF992)